MSSRERLLDHFYEFRAKTSTQQIVAARRSRERRCPNFGQNIIVKLATHERCLDLRPIDPPPDRPRPTTRTSLATANAIGRYTRHAEICSRLDADDQWASATKAEHEPSSRIAAAISSSVRYGLRAVMMQTGERRVQNVLVVDDDELILKSWERALRADGKTVYVATNIEAALAVRPLPDVAIVDLYLAHAELGIDVIRELKCLDPTIYTVLVSAAMSVPQAVDGMRDGADDCAVKPIAPRQLLRRIEHGEPSAIVGEMLTLDDVEWKHISRALSDCGGNISHAAKALGIHRQSLQRKLRLRAARGATSRRLRRMP